MSHAYSNSEQTQTSNPRPPPNAAFIQASSSSNLSGPYAPGTTLPSAIIISDDGLGSTSSISESPASSIPQRAASVKRKHEVITISDDSDGEDPTARFFKAARQDPIFMNGNVNRREKRLDTYLKRPPFRFQDRLDRAMTQRMFLIGRERKWHEDGTHQIEKFDMAGTTGNVYKVTICKLPRCTCPDAMQRGKQCKHIIYVLVNILKAPERLQYQEALLSWELHEIFSRAPVTPQSSVGSLVDTLDTGKRKSIEDDCPICVMEFKRGEDIVWCKAACGNNIHKACFDQWAKSKPGPAKCVYCRAVWKEDEPKSISLQGPKNKEGYVNVASELGLSGVRDHSSYWGSFDDYGEFRDYY